ncbi:hypothetical protein, partial [Staphylococcus chromogenes]|uniref:hypothetical protein n=1 Tax=Staphylococcus chromogenes TaxID=46126 RepID=UPI0029052C30
TTNVDLTIKNEYQIQLQFDTHLGLHFHFLYSKTELLTFSLKSFNFSKQMATLIIVDMRVAINFICLLVYLTKGILIAFVNN